MFLAVALGMNVNAVLHRYFPSHMVRHAAGILLVHFPIVADGPPAARALSGRFFHHLLPDDAHCRSPAHFSDVEARVHARKLAGQKNPYGQSISQFNRYELFVVAHAVLSTNRMGYQSH